MAAGKSSGIGMGLKFQPRIPEIPEEKDPKLVLKFQEKRDQNCPSLAQNSRGALSMERVNTLQYREFIQAPQGHAENLEKSIPESWEFRELWEFRDFGKRSWRGKGKFQEKRDQNCPNPAQNSPNPIGKGIQIFPTQPRIPETFPWLYSQFLADLGIFPRLFFSLNFGNFSRFLPGKRRTAPWLFP